MTAASAWNAKAPELADWALARFFARTDRYGGYYVKDGATRKTSKPSKGPVENVVHRGRVMAHFRATHTDDVIGPYSLAPEPNCVGRVASADVDAHDETADAERNRRYAEHLYFNLAADGFRPLAANWGEGSFHVHALFDRDVSGDLLFRFGRWLVADAAEFGFPKRVESFPKQPSIAPEQYGNWLRLVGRHHTRDVWGSVFDGTTWLEGEPAVAHVLSLTGDSPELIPAAAREFDTERPATRLSARERAPDPAGDVFGAFNAAQTMHSVAAILQRNGWASAGRRGERWDFRRPGKGDDKSGNLMLVSGVPIFYGFTDAAGIPDHRGMNPTTLRAALEFAGDYARLALALRAEGYGAPMPTRSAPPTEVPSGSAGNDSAPPPPNTPPADPPPAPAPRTGTLIILDHFRETYRPDFRRGNAIHTAAGEVVPMSVAISVPTSALISKLADAVDAPRDRRGDLVRQSLPRFFSTWSKVAWGDLVAGLPDEDGAKLGGDDAAAIEFKRFVKNALLSQIVLGNQIGTKTLDMTQTERRSVIGWCKRFGVAGPWRSVRDYQIWSKCRGVGPDVVLMVALRHELFAQLKADRSLCELNANSFTRRCERYGIGTSSRDARPGGKSAVVLDENFVLEMTTGLPEGFGSDDYPEFWQASEKPNMRAG